MIWQPEFTDKTLSRKPGAVHRPFIFGQPHTQQFFLTFDIDAQCQEHRFVDDATVLPNFQDDTVKINVSVQPEPSGQNLTN
ncbi:tail protein from Bacteriophage (fragment) [Escherichia coli]